MKVLQNPIDFCVVLPDNRRTFEYFQSFVVALAKSQDHRVIYGVFSFGGYIRCGTSMVVCLGNPVTRASQSGEGGPRIEPGGKAVRSLSLSSDYAKTWLLRVMYASTERTVVFEHGKAVLCSSIHQRVIHTRGYQRDT